MKKEYEIKYEPIILSNGTLKDKWNIYYYVNDEFELKEFHSYDGISGEIRIGYNKKQ